nr:OmpA family protein [Desulfobulbaceae bacterium]
MLRYVSILIICVLITACGSKTTVILLPDEGKESAGAVIVQTDKASQIVDTPYSLTTVSGASGQPSLPEPISKEKVFSEFHTVIQAAPIKPISFTLYFLTSSTTLTQQSKEQIPLVVAEAKKRVPSEISIIGHTDSTGSKEYNNKLSLQRAKAVETLLENEGADMTTVYISHHGEGDPLIPTKDNVAEPKNRRVEIMIR